MQFLFSNILIRHIRLNDGSLFILVSDVISRYNFIISTMNLYVNNRDILLSRFCKRQLGFVIYVSLVTPG